MDAKEERTDEIGFGGLTLIQKPGEFCYGVDAILLAAFAADELAARKPAAAAEIVADLGTGTGVIPLILSRKTKAKELYGIELQRDSWERACRNSRANGLADRVFFINGDVKDAGASWGAELKGKVSAVTCNPPYVKKESGLTGDVPARITARHETTASLADFMICAAYLLKTKGDFFLIHRPSRLVDVFCAARANRLEPKLLRFVSPKKDAPANMVLIHMVKDGGSELKFAQPLCIYEEDGSYTPEALAAYR